MGNCITEKDSQLVISSTGLRIGMSGMQGWRQEMEDAHVAIDMPSQKDHIFLAIFDGHGGKGAAVYAGNNIVKSIEDTEQWREYVKTGAKNLELLNQALVSAFRNIDAKIRIEQEKPNNGADSSGCTANTAMITPTHILCANAGDSRCVLANKKLGAIPMSFDHKPNDAAEKSRIEAAGGTVHMKRVDGDLAVSRTFGDFAYKQRDDLSSADQKVSNIPDIMTHIRNNSEDEFMILACDGLWDVMTNDDAVMYTRALLTKGESNPMLVAEEIIDLALEKNSRDNISAVVALLPAVAVGPASEGGVAKLRAERTKSNHNRLQSSIDGEEHSG